MSEPADPWYADGLQFTCTSCGHCCKGPEPGWVVMDDDDVERLCEHLDLTPDEFGRQFLRRSVYRGKRVVSLTEHPVTKDCVFWEDGRGCTVYHARPLQCRQWPFWPELLADRVSWEVEAESCPGMNKGRRYSLAEIERIVGGERGTVRGKKPRSLPSV